MRPTKPMKDPITATYDPEHNVASVDLVAGVQSCRTVVVGPGILLDFAADDESVISIELLSPKPRPRLAHIAAEHGFAHLLDDIYCVLDMALGAQVGAPAKLGVVRTSVPYQGRNAA